MLHNNNDKIYSGGIFMSEFSFIEQMEENVKFNLVFPFHIDFDKLIGNSDYNEEYSDSFHCHTFEEVLRKAYLEPKAFYLTQDDAEYYSAQELEFINKVVEDEKSKLDKGYEIINLDLDAHTMEMMEKYKEMTGLTFEEAVVEILKTAVEHPEWLEGLKNE
jgi:hypothetical protein